MRNPNLPMFPTQKQIPNPITTISIEDISESVKEQRENNLFSPYTNLLTPTENIYPFPH
jgi:hypothetical protein